MKAYLSFFRMRLVNGLQYRTAALAGVITQFFWGFMEIQLYRAFYADHSAAFPMQFPHLVSYIWLRQAFWALLNTWTYENELFDMILNGNVAYELCRPTSLYGMWFSRTAALRLSRAALRFWPILLVAALLPEPYRMHLAATPLTFVWFLLSLALTVCVTVALTLIVYFSCFYTVSADGIRAILMPLTDFLCGGMIPLPFMPKGLARALQYSPFGAMLNAPLRIYSGDIAGHAMAETMLLQVFWLGVLCAVGYWMQKRGMKHLCVQGG